MRTLFFHMRGGLGNQLFQLQAASFYSLKFDAKAILQDYSIIKHRVKTRRSWIRRMGIETFVGDARVSMESVIKSLAKSKGIHFSNPLRQFDEEEIAALPSLHQDICINGWFQSSKYVHDFKPTINPDIQKIISRSCSRFVQVNQNDANSAAIHLRLGDFRTTKDGILPAEYYFQGMEQLRSFGIKRIDCFSDEIYGAQDYLKPFGKSIEIHFPEKNNPLNPVELLYTLSSYRFFISSNSTLSWWASYLNDRSDANIYCNWNDDLYIKKWHKI